MRSIAFACMLTPMCVCSLLRTRQKVESIYTSRHLSAAYAMRKTHVECYPCIDARGKREHRREMIKLIAETRAKQAKELLVAERCRLLVAEREVTRVAWFNGSHELWPEYARQQTEARVKRERIEDER
jgi:hypothetical protein